MTRISLELGVVNGESDQINGIKLVFVGEH
jgi:hypothetical protein